MTEPGEIADLVRTSRKELDARGFTKTEIHLNEWRYAPGWGDLTPKRAEDWATVPAFFKRATGGKGAAYAAAVLVRMQDEPIDMMNFYTADTSPWSMFGTFGIRTPVYHAFVAFNEVAKRPARAACDVAASGEPSVVIASRAEDGRSAVVLVSTFGAAAGPRELRIAGLPWTNEARLEALLIDGDHALEPILARAAPAATDGAAITLSLPADAVCLVRLTKPHSSTVERALRSAPY